MAIGLFIMKLQQSLRMLSNLPLKGDIPIRSQDTPQTNSIRSQDRPQANSIRSQDRPQANSIRSQDTPQTNSIRSQDTPQANSIRSQDRPQANSIRSQDLPLPRSIRSQLLVTPARSLLDCPVSIFGVDLPTNSPVTLTTKLTCPAEDFDFRSTCRYMTSRDGTLDIATQPTLDCSDYEGVHDMGPFWCIQPANSSTSPRLWPANIATTINYQMELADEGGENLATAHCEKHFMASGVERLPFAEGRVRGTLFLPPIEYQPAPVIITLYGGINKGKVPEDRAAMFASHGFASLALAYFGIEGMPKIYTDIDIGYFEEAVDVIQKHPAVVRERVGVWGTSQGGNIALGMMAFLKEKVKGVVTVGAQFAAGPAPVGKLVYKGDQVLPSEMATGMKNGNFRYMDRKKEHLYDPKRQLRFENSPADLLAIEGSEDPLGADDHFATLLYMDRARKAGKENMRLVTYPGMGHLVDLPYSPFCCSVPTSIAPKGVPLFMGGQQREHSLGQIDCWRKTIEFFKTTLNPINVERY